MAEHYCPNCDYTYPSIYDRGECCPICHQEGYPTTKNELTEENKYKNTCSAECGSCPDFCYSSASEEKPSK